MSFLSSIRQTLFWSTDTIRGGAIKKHYNEIKLINENKQSTEAKILKGKYLVRLLNHAIKNTNFYSEAAKKADLSSFPVINKDIIRSNYESFQSKEFLNKKNIQVSTGGSTGTPFKLFHNKNKRNRHLADNIYFAENGGYQLGDKLYLIRAWHKTGTKYLIQSFKRNIRLYGVINYTDKDMAKLLLDMQTDKNNKSIVCFASMCDILVNYLDNSATEEQLNGLNIKSIITDGDALNVVTKDKMQYYFKTPTVARYGNMECGIMAQQSYSGGHEYQLNEASYYFEVLDLKEDKPVKPGEVGRIVVTDLFNYCVPLIRYDTGDLASYNVVNNVTVFERIEGRKVDLIYNTSGDILSPYMVVQKMSEYSELKQFQFAQKDKKEYIFRLNPWTSFNQEQELIADSKTYLGNDANVTIEYVEEVPLLSSGKRKQVINEMN
ncbi:hypothetical protein ACFSKN_02560 [Mariniflexile gromovii]|uniref:Phenylacetate-CoA ligase n=1 Tax=Mariniflexile gromovii TaxID=362523 RepID=A0ABS4BR22_9FLAO|nr:hypothetical protein [Mariniflexile gromovii]MBP0902486.1 hypothetical protein [Mariniflexile gromovii]